MKTAACFGLRLGLVLLLAPSAMAQVPSKSTGAKTAPPRPTSTQKLAPPSHQAFVLFEFDVHDKVAFKTLAQKVRESVKPFKGEFLMREKVDSLFGGKASNLSVISFPTIDDAKTWLKSPDLGKLRAERDRVADVRTYLVEKIE